jgi:hypothetical protein
LEHISWAYLELFWSIFLGQIWSLLSRYVNYALTPLKIVVVFEKSIVVFSEKKYCCFLLAIKTHRVFICRFLFVSMAPKEKRDPAWLHCQLIDGSMVCNYCKKEVGRGGIHRIKQHLANARGNIKPCLEVSDELKAEMMGLLEGFQEDKSKTKKAKKEVGRSSGGTRFDSDPQDRMPSFEESSAFPILGHDPYTNPREEVEHVGGSGAGASGSKRPLGNLESFFLPRTTPSSQPTIYAKWKKIEREAAWECIVRYDADIPFNAARSVYYQPMLDVVASCGSGFKGPGYEDIRGDLLKNEVERVKEYLTDFKES